MAMFLKTSFLGLKRSFYFLPDDLLSMLLCNLDKFFYIILKSFSRSCNRIAADHPDQGRGDNEQQQRHPVPAQSYQSSCSTDILTDQERVPVSIDDEEL
jgi:hypothetical protein